MRAERQIVRHMRVRGPSRTAVMRLVPEIEDALSTTSWPGQVAARSAASVLQIRRLSLPRLTPGMGRFAIARLIGAQIAQGHLVFATAQALPDDAERIIWPDRTEMLVGAAVAAAVRGPRPAEWWQSAGVPQSAVPVTPQGFATGVLQFSDAGGPDLVPAALLRLITAMPQVHLQHWLPSVLRVWQAARPLPDPVQQSDQRPPVLPDVRSEIPADLSAPPAISHETLVAVLDLSTGLPSVLRAKIIGLLATRSIGPKAQRWFLTQVLKATTNVAAHAGVAAHLDEVLARKAVPGAGPAGKSVAPDRDARVSHKPDARALSPLPPITSERAEQAAEEVPADDVPADLSHTSAAPDPSEMTRLGGLVVLMNMIGHLKIPVADAGAGTDYATQVLRLFGERLAADDALTLALPDAGPDPLAWLGRAEWPDFVPKLTWLGLKRPLLVRRITGRPGRAALCLPGGRACVGIVNAGSLRALRADTDLVRADPLDLSAAQLHSRLLAGLALLVQGSLRSVGAGPWRAVVRRPGYVVHSLTHIDVTLDLEDIRLEERRAGLDASPGWLPWMGRIVSLHFERFDRPQGMKGGRDE